MGPKPPPRPDRRPAASGSAAARRRRIQSRDRDARQDVETRHRLGELLDAEQWAARSSRGNVIAALGVRTGDEGVESVNGV